jgi:hypothetical protein
MRRCEPGDLHVELSLILGEGAFEDARSDRTCDLATVARCPLHHHDDDILRMVVWRETGKPSDIFLVATVRSLRSTGFSSHHHIFQTRSAARAATFINNLPKPFADQFDSISWDFVT